MRSTGSAARGSPPLSWGAALSLAAVAALFFYAVRFVLVPFVYAAIVAFLLNPFVSFLETRSVRRDRAVLILLVLTLFIVTGLSYWGVAVLRGDLPELRASWPSYVERTRVAMANVRQVLEYQWPSLGKTHLLDNTLNDGMAWMEHHLWRSTGFYASLLECAVNIVLAPFIAFFFLRGGSHTAQLALDACPGEWVERFLSLLNKFGRVFGSYTRGLIVEAFLVGALTALALTWMGVDYAALIGIITGVANVVPYFGPVLGGAVGIVAALFQFENMTGPLRVMGVFFLVHYVDSWMLQPAIMKKAVNLNPVTVTFALLCGAKLGGAWGLVFAVPVAGLIKESGRVFYDWYRAERGLILPSKEFSAAAAKPWIV